MAPRLLSSRQKSWNSSDYNEHHVKLLACNRTGNPSFLASFPTAITITTTLAPTPASRSASYITILITSSATPTATPGQSVPAQTSASNLTRAQASGITAAALACLLIFAGIGMVLLRWRRSIHFTRVPTLETGEVSFMQPSQPSRASEVPSQTSQPNSERGIAGGLNSEELDGADDLESNDAESMSLLEGILEIYETPFPAGRSSLVPATISAFSASSDGDGQVVTGNGQRATCQGSSTRSSNRMKWSDRRKISST
ncbi:hypothetical protein LTR78_009352 [Recurvomyces mirabilis]|uniref:Uncharacterized protein n=1 Tax=Recurvomyces mirabilis TaxID=574656 RepID=A0AAE0WIH9_9PEZI|nr:hypothetical protein LTR78_009352 [Recurvomyces mirabilis]